MTVLHVREQGATVRREAEQIKVTGPHKRAQRQQVLAAVPVRELEQVLIYGNVQLTTQAAALLLQHEIDIVFLSLYGSYRGHFLRSGSKFARLRHAQLRLASDERHSLDVAKAIVRAKLANQRNTLRQQSQPSDAAPVRKIEDEANRIDNMRRASSQALDLDALRGFEGRAGAHYFSAFRSLLPSTWSFNGRKFYPPPDPFNALLSFGYALLLKDMNAAIQVVGLDPYLGCFHALEYDRPSLTLDLMEEFRPLAVDRPMLQLALAGVIQPADFTVTRRTERPVELGETLIPKVIAAYEEQMRSPFSHPTSGDNALRRCLELQARAFARTVLGSREGYEGLVG